MVCNSVHKICVQVQAIKNPIWKEKVEMNSNTCWGIADNWELPVVEELAFIDCVPWLVNIAVEYCFN